MTDDLLVEHLLNFHMIAAQKQDRWRIRGSALQIKWVEGYNPGPNNVTFRRGFL